MSAGRRLALALGGLGLVLGLGLVFLLEYFGRAINKPEDAEAYLGAPVVGVIPSVSDAFCKVCNRIRLTAEGHLRTCLFSIGEHDVKALLRGGASDDAIREFVAAAVWQKEEGHKIGQADFVRPSKTMSQIGG